jgi:hypothetical protein
MTKNTNPLRPTRRAVSKKQNKDKLEIIDKNKKQKNEKMKIIIKKKPTPPKILKAYNDLKSTKKEQMDVVKKIDEMMHEFIIPPIGKKWSLLDEKIVPELKNKLEFTTQTIQDLLDDLVGNLSSIINFDIILPEDFYSLIEEIDSNESEIINKYSLLECHEKHINSSLNSRTNSIENEFHEELIAFFDTLNSDYDYNSSIGEMIVIEDILVNNENILNPLVGCWDEQEGKIKFNELYL